MKKPPNDGKAFELLTQKIQQQLAPNAIVTHNEKIIGKSGATNQIDVCLRGTVGQFSFFCIIECKDWTNKVDIDTVRAFATKVTDVNAHQGVLVSRSGFTSEAAKLGESESIILYTLLDAEFENWKNIPLIPILFIKIELGSASLKMADAKTHENINYDAKIEVVEHSSEQNVSIKKFMENRWDEVFETREPNGSELFETKLGEFSIKNGENLRPVLMQYSLTSQREYYFGKIPVQKGLGLVDHKTGALLSPEFTSAILPLKEMTNWPKIDSIEAAQNPAVMTILLGKFFTPRSKKAPQNIVIHQPKDGPLTAFIAEKD